jgi:hypothetical protein
MIAGFLKTDTLVVPLAGQNAEHRRRDACALLLKTTAPARMSLPA